MSLFTLEIVLLVYLMMIVFLGYLGYKKTKDAKDYLIGGGDMNPFVMTLSYGATFISASAIVGFGGVAAVFGMGIQWLCFLNMAIGIVGAYIFFGRPTRRLGVKIGAKTFAQLLGFAHQSRAIRIFVALVIFLGMPLYAAVVLKGGAVFVEQMFKIDYHIALLIFTLIVSMYVIAGGIKGVMYTDAMQACIMFVCMLLLLLFFYDKIGMGFTEANQKLTAMVSLVPEKYMAEGHRGWTAMPAFGSSRWYILITSLIMGVGIGCLAQPQLVVRFMTVKSSKELNRGIFIGCLFIFITVGAIYHVGALSNLFFLQTEGKIAADVVPDLDKIIPYFIDKAMPVWFSALFMLCILSASMSTLSAQFHTMGAALGSDIFDALSKKSGDAVKTNAIRLGIILSILLSYCICYILPFGIIARGTAIFMGVCAATFLPAYFCTLYWPRTNKTAVLWSMYVGLISSLFSLLFLHKSEAAPMGLSKLLTGKEVLIADYPWYMIDPIIFALPLSIVTIVIVSFLRPKYSLSSNDSLYEQS